MCGFRDDCGPNGVLGVRGRSGWFVVSARKGDGRRRGWRKREIVVLVLLLDDYLSECERELPVVGWQRQG